MLPKAHPQPDCRVEQGGNHGALQGLLQVNRLLLVQVERVPPAAVLEVVATETATAPRWFQDDLHAGLRPAQVGEQVECGLGLRRRARDHGQLARLADEIRAFLVEKVSRTGGHLGPNLGAVELTLALHRVFDSPRDRIIWDTGHQSYVHKMLTGRAPQMPTLRQAGGLSGYPRQSESEHDLVENSHASTALSYADGIAKAYALQGRRDDAERLFKRLMGLCNDVGLLSEEYDSAAKRLVGNFPQAFSHIALVDTALTLGRSDGATKQRSETGQASGGE